MKTRQLSGISYILIAAVLYAIMPVLVRLLGREIPPFALGAALLTSLYYIGRRLLKHYSASFIMVYSTILGALGIGAISLISERGFYLGTMSVSFSSVSLFTWFIVVVFGIDNFSAWLLLNKGLQTVEVGVGSIVLLSELLFAVAIGVVFYQEIPTFLTVIGASFIAVGSILAAKSKAQQ